MLWIVGLKARMCDQAPHTEESCRCAISRGYFIVPSAFQHSLRFVK
jgi:hypothetical protein